MRKLRNTKPHNGQLCEFIIFVQIQLNVARLGSVGLTAANWEIEKLANGQKSIQFTSKEINKIKVALFA